MRPCEGIPDLWMAASKPVVQNHSAAEIFRNIFIIIVQ
jgi:hypothetical protein